MEILGAVLVVILVIIIANIKIVPQAHEFVIELLGKYKSIIVPLVYIILGIYIFIK